MLGVDDLVICQRLRVPAVVRPPRVTITVRWKPPPSTCYKLNVDGSVHDGYIHAGCIVRNSRGFFVAAFSRTLGRGFLLM